MTCKKNTLTIVPDTSFNERSTYRWVNILRGTTRVGKARGFRHNNTLVIHSIQVFPEFQHQGVGEAVITLYKESYSTIIADRVRNTAKEFWEKMGFVDNRDGNFVWEKYTNI